MAPAWPDMSLGNGDSFSRHWGTGFSGSRDRSVTSVEVRQPSSPPVIMTNWSGGGPAVVVVVVGGVVVVVTVVVVAHVVWRSWVS